MPALLAHINQSYPPQVPILIGAPEELVQHRQLINKYETNRDIKTWSCWFLLKALTTTGKIQQWRKQLNFLLPWLQLNERTLYRRLEELQKLQLVTLDEDGNISLTSYENAAKILDIVYLGTYNLTYNPNKNAGKQIFQYLLRAEEIRSAQDHQLSVLKYKLDKNPSLKNDLHAIMVKAGADGQRLFWDSRYYQERLLQLQLHAFKEGTELLAYVFTHRADINRGVASIAKAHCYKATQSVSYMKKRMWTLQVIQVNKKHVNSNKRSRLYYFLDVKGEEKRVKKEAYRWNDRIKTTVLNLTDQISFLYESMPEKTGRKKAAKAA